MCSARWMFSMLTRRMKSGCASWWSKVSSASRRMAATGSRCSTSTRLLGAPDLGVRPLEHGDVTAAPCRRSSSRSCAWWCACARRSRRPGRRRSRARRTRGLAISRISAACPLGVTLAPVAACSSTCRGGIAPPCARGWPGPRIVCTGTLATDRPGNERTSSYITCERETSATERHEVGLIGAGIGASLSPALHEREAAEQGLSYAYRLIDIERARSDDACRRPARAGSRAGFSGLNVTHPCKQASSPHLDALSADAARCRRSTPSSSRTAARPATTPTRPASPRASRAACRTRRSDTSSCSGPAARAPRSRTRRCGSASSGSRSSTSTPSGRATLRATSSVRPRRGGTLDELADADGLIHATPTGMEGHPGLPLDEELLHPGLWVADVVYRPLETRAAASTRASSAAARSTAAGWRSSRRRARSSCSPASSPTASGCCATSPSSSRTDRRHALMRRSIATVCLSGTLDEKLAAAARAGFDGVELFETDLVNSPLAPAEVRRRAEDLGLTVDLYQPFRDFEAVRGDLRAQPAPRRGQVRRDGAARRADDARLLQRLAGGDRRRRARGRAAARAGRAGRRARAEDRLRGAGLGPPRERVRPLLADRRRPPTTRRSASAWTPSTSCRSAATSTRSPRSRATRSSTSSSPTRRSW